MPRVDPHSYTDDAQPTIRHLTWHARIDFDRRRLSCTATLELSEPTREAQRLDLDTRELSVTSAGDGSGAPLPFTFSANDPILGARLSLALPQGCRRVVLTYDTGVEASALQWLTAAQTQGGRHPYLFSQCQAIHARSLVPCQDTPARRLTYTATLTVPTGLTAVMAAAPGAVERGPRTTTFHFTMPQPIAPYLLAFAVGELEARDLSPRCRVWAEPEMIEAAAWELADVERQLQAAETLFGPYDWDRYDVLVMPPSFPYGGMENPRLTFLTPTLIAGDRSLMNVVVHEMAHSWSGNLVTNTNAEHFWLNEGFTVYAERRIIEALHGDGLAAMHAALGRKELEGAIRRFTEAGTPQLTRLRTHLEGVDPDEAFSQVPYEKGALLLVAMERAMGRPAFDAWLKRWFAERRFQAVSTQDFIDDCKTHAPGVLERIGASRWLDEPGLPADAPVVTSTRLAALEALVGTVPSHDAVSDWSPTEWSLFLEATPRTTHTATLDALDARFHLSDSKNAEVHVAWLQLALEAGLERAAPLAQALLGRVGRMKYLKPLYRALAASEKTRPLALATFEANRARYHPIAQQVVAGVLKPSAR